MSVLVRVVVVGGGGVDGVEQGSVVDGGGVDHGRGVQQGRGVVGVVVHHVVLGGHGVAVAAVAEEASLGYCHHSSEGKDLHREDILDHQIALQKKFINA